LNYIFDCILELIFVYATVISFLIGTLGLLLAFIETVYKIGNPLVHVHRWRPESDGGSEVANKMVEATIRAHVNHMHTNWSELLCMVEFAIINSKHSYSRFTPFL
jgi:hypothetical protein